MNTPLTGPHARRVLSLPRVVALAIAVAMAALTMLLSAGSAGAAAAAPLADKNNNSPVAKIFLIAVVAGGVLALILGVLTYLRSRNKNGSGPSA